MFASAVADTSTVSGAFGVLTGLCTGFGGGSSQSGQHPVAHFPGANSEIPQAALLHLLRTGSSSLYSGDSVSQPQHHRAHQES